MIEFVNVSKSYKNKIVIKGINFKIDEGELVVLIGPSGCGKTTTLKMINKLILPSSGSILIDGKDISKENTIELRRNIGYVIQQTGLFPHMTVAENIGLVPKLKKWTKEDIIKRTYELMEMVGMNGEDYMDRYPEELSGGQQQRIGVARAFATNPDIILMDEPFSALDPITRNQLQDEVFAIQQELKKTIVFVTHDMDEALKLGDRICIMKDGEILQFDTPEKILKDPAEGFVEEFIGKNRIWNKPELIKVSDIMIEDPVTTNEGRTVLQAINIMKQRKVDSLLIVDKENLLKGIVTLKALKKGANDNLKIKDIMEKDIIYIKENESIVDILTKMNDTSVGYLPVLNESNKLKGLVTKSRLISVLSSQYID